MSLLNKTFTMPRTKFNKGFIHIGKTFKVGKKIAGLERRKITLLKKNGTEASFSTCAGIQWIENALEA